VLACLGVSEALCETEIDDVYVVLFFSNADQEVIGLDVSVKEVARVYKLDSLQLKIKFVKISNVIIEKIEIV
jgi:hypothetical protein